MKQDTPSSSTKSDTEAKQTRISFAIMLLMRSNCSSL